MVSALKDAGLTPVAAICAFQDPIAARADRTMAIHYRDAENPQSDYLWLDAAANAGGKPWLNPLRRLGRGLHLRPDRGGPQPGL